MALLLSTGYHYRMTDSVLLRLHRYPSGSPLHRSDQITVPTATWERFYRDHRFSRPVFVAISESVATNFDGVVGRIRPAPSTGGSDSCQVPDWMWLRLGAPDDDFWVVMMERPIADAGQITLRPRREQTLVAAADPLEMLTAALSGSAGGGEHSWACLVEGMELPLACGVFDVVGIHSCDGYPVSVGCILNTDVRLELLPALDTATPAPAAAAVSVAPAPAPAPATAGPGPEVGVMWFHGMESYIDGNYWRRPVKVSTGTRRP